MSQLLGGELHEYHGSHTDHECWCSSVSLLNPQVCFLDSLRRREDGRQSEEGVFSAKNLP